MSKEQLNDGYYFEVMDRAHVCLEHFNTFVGEHIVLEEHPEFKELCDKASEALMNVYQAAGQLHFENTED